MFEMNRQFCLEDDKSKNFLFFAHYEKINNYLRMWILHFYLAAFSVSMVAAFTTPMNAAFSTPIRPIFGGLVVVFRRPMAAVVFVVAPVTAAVSTAAVATAAVPMFLVATMA